MTAAYVSIVFGSVFLILVTLLHFLKRELDPSWRMISEYEIGRHGWMMRLAFFCWGRACWRRRLPSGRACRQSAA